MKKNNCDEIVIIDFETTGLSPNYSRIIEVGAIIVKKQNIIGSFSQLMNPGQRIPYVIKELTGITNAMIRDKPTPEVVMPRLKKFIGDRVILAHNASFDSKFLYAEMKRVNILINNPILCTLLLSRRLIPNVSNYKLGTLVKHLNIKMDRAHRALDDVKATAKLWEHLYKTVCKSTGNNSPDDIFFAKICKKPKKEINQYFRQIREVQFENQ